MKKSISCLIASFGLVCFAAAPTRTVKPLFPPAAVTCFIGKIDSQSSCTSVMTKAPAPEDAMQWSRGMTCGNPGQISELQWKYAGSENGADIYEVSRRFPSDASESKTVTKTIKFAGKRVVLFEDQFQVIVFDPPKEPGK